MNYLKLLTGKVMPANKEYQIILTQIEDDMNSYVGKLVLKF